MRRLNALAVSVLLAAAGVAGTYATMQTLQVGKQTQSEALAPDKVISSRKKKLDRWEAQLKQAGAKRPPGLPGIPRYTPVAMPQFKSPDLRSPTRANTSTTSAPKPKTEPKTSTPKPPPAKPPPAPEEQIIYVQPPPIIKTVQPAVEAKSCSDAEVKAIKERVKAQIAPLEAEKAQLKAQIEQLEADFKAREAALRAQLDPLKQQAETLEGDAKKQFKATYITPLETQLNQLKSEKEATLGPLKARQEELKAQIEQVWTDAFANPSCTGA